jgi:adenosylcobinamide kinase / adenosylcobinamide-phosphate guanylyltransferase
VSPRTVLVLGGVRAGKSAFAVARARELGGRVVFVATAEAGDAEMAARIARHRAERPSSWRTVEVPVELPSTLLALEGEADVVVVDCLNLWVANLLTTRPGLSDSDLLTEAADLEAAMTDPRYSLILVSNEVGWGVHPETALGRRFRDALGLVNQAAARGASDVVLMVAGCPLVVKSADTPPSAGGGRVA